MSYKLINANNTAFNSDGFITAKNIEKMPCIYADLPNGMDGEHYVLEQEPTEWQRDHAVLKAYSDGADDVLDKIRAEIEELDNKVCQQFLIEDVDKEVHHAYQDCLKIIDKYKAESEDKE